MRSTCDTEPRISIVIPALNEARNLEVLLPTLPAVHQVILVDGNSTDDTVDIARKVIPAVHVVAQSRLGKGNALLCGFAAATGDIVVMLDADGSADPLEIPRFVDALKAGADFAKGTRFAGDGGSYDITRFRSLGNRMLNVIANAVMKTNYTDLCYGYNAFWADILPRLNLPDVGIAPELGRMTWGDGFEIETILSHRAARAHLYVVEVPSIERNRLFGVSNLRAISDGTRVLRTIFHERSRSEFIRPRPEIMISAELSDAAGA